MNPLRRLPFLLLLVSLTGPARLARAQSVGIGTATPDPAAALDISSSGKGLLIPRLDSAQRRASSSACSSASSAQAAPA